MRAGLRFRGQTWPEALPGKAEFHRTAAHALLHEWWYIQILLGTERILDTGRFKHFTMMK